MKFLRSVWALWQNRKLLQHIGDLLRTQDNRITGEPLFCVQKMRRVYGIDPQWGEDKYIWQYTECSEVTYESDEDLRDALLEEADDDAPRRFAESYPDGHFADQMEWEGSGVHEKIYYVAYWETVTVHFTEEAADLYVKQNAHNLGEHRVYVTSQYRCHDWIDLRKFLMEC